MKKCYIVIIVLSIIFIFIHFNLYHLFFIKGYTPINGFVQDEKTALKIAEVVWLEIYGDSIYETKPFVAKYNLILGYWVITGTLPENMLGGVPEAHIRKKDGKILYVNHGA